MSAMIQGRKRTELSRFSGMSRRRPSIGLDHLAFAGAELGNLAVFEMEPGMAEARHQRLVMRRDDERGAELVHLFEEPQQTQCHLVIDIAGGLVGEQQAGPADHRARDGDALLLAARQRRRSGVELVGEADPAQQLGHVLADLLLGEARDAQRQRDIVEGGEMFDQAEILEHDADLAAQRRQLAPGRRGDVATEQRDEAARRPLGQIHELQQAGLAGAAGPGEEVEGTGCELHADVAQHLGPRAIPHADILETNQGARSPSHRGASHHAPPGQDGTMRRFASSRAGASAPAAPAVRAAPPPAPAGRVRGFLCFAPRLSLIRGQRRCPSDDRYLPFLLYPLPCRPGCAGRDRAGGALRSTGRVQLPAVSPPPRRLSVAGWAAYVVVLAGIVAGGLWWTRDEVASRWPATAHYYQMLGIPVE